jgi:hypothetical protein
MKRTKPVVLTRSILAQISRMKMRGSPPMSIASVTGLPMNKTMDILSVHVVPSPSGKSRTARPPNLVGIAISPGS